MKEFLKKYKKKLLSIFIILIMFFSVLTIILIFINRNKENKINEIHENYYSLKYDNTWRIAKEDDFEISLLHKKSKSELQIKINELQNENQYRNLDEILDSFLYNIQEQNKDYKLIFKEETSITKDNIDGYKMLFETDDTQSAIYLYKQGDKLIVFTYEAINDYFDILLDSVNNIIYNFSINENKFDVKKNINLETEEINYTEQAELTNLLSNSKQEEIASSNYLVKYSVPDNFKSTSYDTRYGYYNFENVPNGAMLKLSTSILKSNLYEYLDRENVTNVYEEYNLNTYNKEKEQLNKLSEEPLTYIYKNNYLTNNEITENIVLIFELNHNHIFKVKIESQGVGIPEKLVNMIKINEFKNIANNINIIKEDGFLIGKLKEYTDYTCEKTQEITLKLPENYQEVDEETNLYEERNYISEYDETTEIPKYKVVYKNISMGIDSQLNILEKEINQNLGEYKNFKQLKDITVNDKTFRVYERGYTELSSETDSSGNKYKYYANEKILFYGLQKDQYLVIIIKEIENKITDELIEQLTKFDINVK